MKKLPGDRFLRSIKYLLLIFFVILFLIFLVNPVGIGDPTFCKYICPAGILFGGIPLTITDEGIRAAAGNLFLWKFGILMSVILGSIVVHRPFCRYLCPLGAIYGLFNPIALLRYDVDKSKCIDCGKCKSVCRMDIDLHKDPNSRLCVRCGKCKKSINIAHIIHHKRRTNPVLFFLYYFSTK